MGAGSKKEPAADMVLRAPWRKLVPSETAAMGMRRSNPKQWVLDEESLAPYGEHSGLLVRTALVRSTDYATAKPAVIRSSRDINRLCRHLASADQEHFVVIGCDTRGRVMAIFESAIGGTSSAAVELPHILKIPLLTGCPTVSVVHNHPSGLSEPSPADVSYTRRVKEGLKCIDIQLIDHVVVAADGYFSFLDSGLLP